MLYGRYGVCTLFEYVLPTVVFVVASRTADVMGGVGSGEIEGAAEMVARSAGQLGPVACERAHFEFLSLARTTEPLPPGLTELLQQSLQRL